MLCDPDFARLGCLYDLLASVDSRVIVHCEATFSFSLVRFCAAVFLRWILSRVFISIKVFNLNSLCRVV